MGELIDALKERYTKKKPTDSKIAVTNVTVKNAIDVLCTEHLDNVGDVFIFEVDVRYLPSAVSVITKEPLKSKYDIVQISPSLFSATLKEIEW